MHVIASEYLSLVPIKSFVGVQSICCEELFGGNGLQTHNVAPCFTSETVPSALPARAVSCYNTKNRKTEDFVLLFW
jgi:hypothetical protein